MRNDFVRSLIVVFMFALCGCGSTKPPVTAPSEASELKATQPAPKVSNAVLTTAVDEEQKKAIAPHSTSFLPDTEQIYFVGTLENLPQDAEIEIRWYRETKLEPLYVSRAVASGEYSFLSVLRSDSTDFADGQYRVAVFVGRQEAGAVPFQIADRRSGGMVRVKELAVSAQVEADTQRPIGKTSAFPMGIGKVYASFYVGGLEPGASVRVSWYRDDELLDEQDIVIEGEKYYSAALTQKKKLPKGDFAVEVDILGEVFARHTFYVGANDGGAVVEKAALGTALGKNNMPKRAKSTFGKNTRVIKCGVQLLGVAANSQMEVRWIFLGEENKKEELVYTTKTKINGSQEVTASLAWEPGGALKPGNYKALIFINDNKLQEIPFKVK